MAWTQMPPDSMKGLPLAKAKPISDDGAASEIMYSRRRKKTATATAARERNKNLREKQPCRNQGQ